MFIKYLCKNILIRTRVETECNETTINVPKEECVQAFEKKCETDYKVIEHYSYNEECTEVIEEVCKELQNEQHLQNLKSGLRSK